MKKLFGLFLLGIAFLVPVSTGQATLVSLPSPIMYPGIFGSTTGPGLSSAATLDAAGEYVAYVFVAREDMTVSHVGFRAATSTGSPTIEVRIETVDGATGLPSGTLWATNTNGTTGTLSSNTNPLQALTASASITKGQVFCVKIAYASGTSQAISQVGNVAANFNTNLPYQVTNTGTPTKGFLNLSVAQIALGSSSTTFYQIPGAWPISAAAAGTFNNTNGAKRGLRFTLPMNARIIGVRWFNGSQIGDYTVGIYTGDASGTEVDNSVTAFEGDITGASPNGVMTAYFDNAVSATAGTAYRVAIEPTTSTNVNVNTLTLPSSDYFSAMPTGTTAAYTSLVSGTWTDSTTQIPLMEIIIDQVDNGAGTGSGGGRIIGG